MKSGRAKIGIFQKMRIKNLMWASEVRLKKLDSFTLETSKNYLIRNFLCNGRLRVKNRYNEGYYKTPQHGLSVLTNQFAWTRQFFLIFKLFFLYFGTSILGVKIFLEKVSSWALEVLCLISPPRLVVDTWKGKSNKITQT